MDTRPFGGTTLRSTTLGFGAWAIGGKGYGPVEERDAVAALDTYVEGGGNFIDTARGYADSERIIGNWLADRGGRDELILATKTGAGSKPENMDRIASDVETSLGLLQIDCVDLVQLHSPPADPAVMDEAIGRLERLREQGKLRFIGASIKGPSVTPETQALCRQYIDTGRIHAIQLIYSVFRPGNAAIFDAAHEAGVALIARTTLESGFLSGKYKPGHRFDSDGDHRRRWTPEQIDELLAAADDLASRAVAPPFESLAEVAFAYAAESPAVSTVIVGAHKAEQVRRNLVATMRPPLAPAQRRILAEARQDDLANPKAN